MNLHCEICGVDLSTNKSNPIEYQGVSLRVCNKCNNNFENLVGEDVSKVEKSKQYFSALEHGRLFSDMTVNGQRIYYIKNRDDIDFRYVKEICESINKMNQNMYKTDNILNKNVSELLKTMNTISEHTSYIKKVARYFYYISLAALCVGVIAFLFNIMLKITSIV